MSHGHSHAGCRDLWRRALLAFALTLIAAPVFAAASVVVNVDGKQIKANQPATMYVEVATTVELVVIGAKVSQPISWPKVNGLTLSGSGSDLHRNAFTFFLTPTRTGDFTVPAFDFRADDGETLHVDPIKFHAVPHS